MQDVPAPAAYGTSRCRRFEFTSRGDRVPGRLLLPEHGPGPYPLVLLQHGIDGAMDPPYLDLAAPWVEEAGVVVASIDLPLYGERRSPKLSETLHRAIRTGVGDREGKALDAASEGLWVEFTRQSIHDLARCLDGMGELDEVDAERIVYASFGLDSLVGAIFCALDPRPRAAALAFGGGGFGPPAVDPASYIAQPRAPACS